MRHVGGYFSAAAGESAGLAGRPQQVSAGRGHWVPVIGTLLSKNG